MEILLYCLKTGGWVLYPIAICAFAYLWLNTEGYLILAFLLALDTLSGIIKTVVIWWKPTSNRLWKWVIAKGMMMCLPLCIALLAKVLQPWVLDISAFVWTSITILCVAEFYSIVQNIVSIKQGKKIEEYDAITEALKWFQKMLRNLLTNIIDDKHTGKEPT